MTERFAHLAKEFGSYPLDSLPDVPAHWEDSSWHNDACPSFIIHDSLAVFVDFPDAADSDFPESRASGDMKRFSLCPMRDRMHVTSDDCEAQGLPANFQSDDWNELLAGAIAETFAGNLREILSAEEWAEMRDLNAEHQDDGVCASHDYCDANMPMADAFEEVIGREPFGEPEGIDSERGQADANLWSRAWNIAKERHLTDPKEARLARFRMGKATADDARILLEEERSAGKPCGDTIAHLESIIETANSTNG